MYRQASEQTTNLVQIVSERIERYVAANPPEDTMILSQVRELLRDVSGGRTRTRAPAAETIPEEEDEMEEVGVSQSERGGPDVEID